MLGLNMKDLKQGRIYFKDNTWVVRYSKDVTIPNPEGPKVLGGYTRKEKVEYIPILEKDTTNLKDPYSQGSQTKFKVIDGYAELWPMSELGQSLKEYFEKTPKEQIQKDWEESKIYDEVPHEPKLKMIPKSEMKHGWYNGICRNNHMAYWDEKDQIFYYLRYSFGFYMDKIEHFEDVKEKGFDGFIPIEKVERFHHEDLRELKNSIGY
jgi:hypothetical protein